MSLKTNIEDGTGGKHQAKVNNKHALLVSYVPDDVPVIGTPNRIRYYNQILGSTGQTDHGSATGSMNVDGSITPVEFYVDANYDYDIHIMTIVILFADLSVSHNLFGKLNPLINGWNLVAYEEGDTTHLVRDAKTGGEVIAQSGLANPYGNTTTSWELTNWTAGSDAQTILIPVSDYIPDGIRIGRGSENKLVSVIADDLTDLDEFYVGVIGFRNYP